MDPVTNEFQVQVQSVAGNRDHSIISFLKEKYKNVHNSHDG